MRTHVTKLEHLQKGLEFAERISEGEKAINNELNICVQQSVYSFA